MGRTSRHPAKVRQRGAPGRNVQAPATIGYFPTPNRVIKEVSDEHVKDMLLRWQREYGYFSGYSHTMFRKLLPAYMARSLKLTTSQKEKMFDTEYVLAIMVSYLAIASACAMAASKELARAGGGSQAVNGIDLLVRLTELWERLRKDALLGQALWNSGARHLCLPIIGAADKDRDTASAGTPLSSRPPTPTPTSPPLCTVRPLCDSTTSSRSTSSECTLW